MTLSELLKEAGVVPDALNGDAELTSITPDSRHAGPGSLFVCMPSSRQDSHAHMGSAIECGAVAVLAHSRVGYDLALSKSPCACLVTAEGGHFEDAIWRIGKTFYRNPTHDMKLVGVTGTNGKTTTAWILRQMLGQGSAYLGTLGCFLPAREIPLANTTPFSLDLNQILAEARDASVTSMAMEVSSHALEQRRAHGLEFDAAIFTNLTQDHLDFHGTMEAYCSAKKKLFTDLTAYSTKPFTAVLNTDDPVGESWSKELKQGQITYGFRSGELRAQALDVRVDRLEIQVAFQGQELRAKANLGGSFNLWNCLSAVGGMLALGYSLGDSVDRLADAKPAPGRFEAVPNDSGIGILIDYAHTPDAVTKLLEAVRNLAPKRIIVVFGCGGDRDRTKRPLMAAAASHGADLTIATSDNPRTEDPESILADVKSGLLPEKQSQVILDRREAIEKAISLALPGDVVVIAGKGHESYQIVGHEKRPFDDRSAATEALSLKL